jgi:hypothetical protein
MPDPISFDVEGIPAPQGSKTRMPIDTVAIRRQAGTFHDEPHVHRLCDALEAARADAARWKADADRLVAVLRDERPGYCRCVQCRADIKAALAAHDREAQP